mmetsp:Transcript_9802/g.12857  ORF Transcript_9802/g.12857 Transcript_9802/m.12857 type:complete len:178 (+) Transcript_9802:246-779(+)
MPFHKSPKGKWVVNFTNFFSFTFFLFVLLNLNGVESKSRRRKADKNFRLKKKDCESNACGHMILDEAQNCIYKCISDECYQQVYASEPLEDGEIDSIRYRQFQACYRKANKVKRRNRTDQQNGGSQEDASRQEDAAAPEDSEEEDIQDQSTDDDDDDDPVGEVLENGPNKDDVVLVN